EFFGGAIGEYLFRHLGDLGGSHLGRLGVRNQSAFEFDERRLTGLELLHEELGRDFWGERLAAGEDVHRGVPMFGPGMYRDVRFGDDDDAADAEGTELVEVGADDGGLRDPGRGDHDLFHSLYIIKEFGVATV